MLPATQRERRRTLIPARRFGNRPDRTGQTRATASCFHDLWPPLGRPTKGLQFLFFLYPVLRMRDHPAQPRRRSCALHKPGLIDTVTHLAVSIDARGRTERPDGCLLYRPRTGHIQAGEGARKRRRGLRTDPPTSVGPTGLVYPGDGTAQPHAYNWPCRSVDRGRPNGAWKSREQWAGDPDISRAVVACQFGNCHADGKARRVSSTSRPEAGVIGGRERNHGAAGQRSAGYARAGCLVRNVRGGDVPHRQKNRQSVGVAIPFAAAADSGGEADIERARLCYLSEGTDPRLLAGTTTESATIIFFSA